MNRQFRKLLNLLISFSLLTLIIPISPIDVKAFDGTEHNWLIERAVNYLIQQKPQLLREYPIYSYIPWLYKGSDIADSIGRQCRWMTALGYGYMGMCDTIHHYGKEEYLVAELTAGIFGGPVPIADPGGYAAPEYAVELFNQALKFWPGDDIPNLSNLRREWGGYTGIGTLTTPLGWTWLGGYPFCEIDYIGDNKDDPQYYSEQCPRWPDWASFYTTNKLPPENVRVALTYLGWSIHLIEDLTNAGHATNKAVMKGLEPDFHGPDEYAMKKLIQSDFDHLPVIPGFEYKYTPRDVVKDYISYCLINYPDESCMDFISDEARRIGEKRVNDYYTGRNSLTYWLTDQRGMMEYQADAAVKLVAATLDNFFNLTQPINIYKSLDHFVYIKNVQERSILWLRPDDHNIRSYIYAEDIGEKNTEVDEYAFQLQRAEEGYYYLLHRNSGKYVMVDLDNPGNVFMLNDFNEKLKSQFEFKLGTAPRGYYLIHKYSRLYACVDMNELDQVTRYFGEFSRLLNRYPLKDCVPPEDIGGLNPDYLFILQISAEPPPTSDQIRSLVYLPPSLVVGLFHTNERDPQGMRLAEIDFLGIERLWNKHGGDKAPTSWATEGFYWWMVKPDTDIKPSDWRLPKGVLLALKHSTNQATDPINLFGYDPYMAFTGKIDDAEIEDYFMGFNGGDNQRESGSAGVGYYWYEFTGENFDWSNPEDRILADRLPRGTVIGLMHNEHLIKTLVWDGVEYNPADT